MSFLGGLEGVVNIRHLSADRPFSPQSYQLKRKLKACLLWVDVPAKAVGLSLSGHLVNRQPVQFQDVEIGDIYSGMTCCQLLLMHDILWEIHKPLENYM